MNNTIIQRIKSISLEKRSDGYYFKNNLFTGVAVEIDKNNGLITNIIHYQDGKSAGQYTGQYLDYNNKLIVDEAFLIESEDGEPYFYNNEVFTGIGLYFKNDICLTETDFNKGYRNSSVENTPEGNLYYLALYNGLTQIYEWYKNGTLKSMVIYSESFRMFFHTNTENALESLGFKGDSFKALEKIKDKIIFPVVNDASLFRHILLADQLFIAGDHITDDLFNNFLENPSIRNVKNLNISETAMTEASFFRITSLQDLKVINFEDMNIPYYILEKIKNKLPDCKITVNREEIVFNSKKS